MDSVWVEFEPRTEDISCKGSDWASLKEQFPRVLNTKDYKYILSSPSLSVRDSFSNFVVERVDDCSEEYVQFEFNGKTVTKDDFPIHIR